MQITIQESPGVIERRGLGFVDVSVVSLFIALVFGLGGLVGGLHLGRQETDRAIDALKLRHGIVGDAPVLVPLAPPPAR